ncbi:MAG: ribonuclease E/G [Parvularculaceae bacterium]
MNRRLLIECGVAQTLAAFIEDDIVTHLWAGPARGEETLTRAPSRGDLYAGRVATVSKSLNAAFVDIGAERPGFAPLKPKEQAPVEGERMIFLVRRPPLGEKGAVLSREWKTGLDGESVAALEASAASTGVGAIGEPVDAAVQAFVNCGPDGDLSDVKVTLDRAEAVAALRDYASVVDIDPDAFNAFDIDQVFAQSLAQKVVLAGGAQLLFHETAAGVLIDIDSAVAAGGASVRLNDRINLAAASRIALELSRRRIGGRVIIDFLPPSNGAARTLLTQNLDAAVKKLLRPGAARLGRIARDGLCDITLARSEQTLLEVASEPAGLDWPAPGRRFNIDWTAKMAIGAIERRLRSSPSARLELLVAPPLADYICGRSWPDKLSARYGARLRLKTETARKADRFEIVE